MTIAHPNEELLRREFDATVAGDMSALIECYADDQVFHYPGRNPAAGEYRGRDGFTKFLGKIGELGVTVTRELHDVVANDEHGIQLITVTASGTGKNSRGVAWRSCMSATARSWRPGSTSTIRTRSTGSFRRPNLYV